MLMFADAWNRNDIQQAVALAEELAAISRRSAPTAAAIYADGGLSSVFLTLGQLKRAEDTASSVMRRDGIRELRTGSVVSSRQDPEHARAFLDRYDIDAASPFARAFVPMFVMAGRLDVARETLERMRGLDLPAPFLNTDAARLALAEGYPERAIALVEPLVVEDATLVRSNVLADAWVAAGNPTEAIRVLERAAASPREPVRPHRRRRSTRGEAPRPAHVCRQRPSDPPPARRAGHFNEIANQRIERMKFAKGFMSERSNARRV